MCRNSEGTTPVSIAASYGRCRTLKLLIEAGGDVNTCDCEGYSVLDFARQSMCPVCYGIILDNSCTLLYSLFHELYLTNLVLGVWAEMKYGSPFRNH